ncbi:NUAK family SNF1-like kinase 1 [Branchiostoma floridae x Branchiostoma belcheri]
METVTSSGGQRHNLKQRFSVLQNLGQGTYGKVKLAEEKKKGKKVAIKTIRKDKVRDSQDMARIRREIEIMMSLKHPHIVEILEVFENKEKIVLVMEFASGGELYDYISERQRLTETEARRIFRQIVSAVNYCHKKGVVHRDLKLENLLLDQQNRVKIADFGLSNTYSHDKLLKTFCGSPLYASPEIVNGKPYHGPEVDCWSLGVVLYALVYGTMPFDGSDFGSLTQQISRAQYFEPSQPSDAAGLIRWCLTVNPKRRATIDDIRHHWWVCAEYEEEKPVKETTPPISHSLPNSQRSWIEEARQDFSVSLKLSEQRNNHVAPDKTTKCNDIHVNAKNMKSRIPRPVRTVLPPKPKKGILKNPGTDSPTLSVKSTPGSKPRSLATPARKALRKNRESGYYSSPERSESADGIQKNKKPALVQNAKNGAKPKGILKKNGKYSSAPNTGECGKVADVANRPASAEGCLSDKSESTEKDNRPSSTYSEESLLSDESFDILSPGSGPPSSETLDMDEDGEDNTWRLCQDEFEFHSPRQDSPLRKNNSRFGHELEELYQQALDICKTIGDNAK